MVIKNVIFILGVVSSVCLRGDDSMVASEEWTVLPSPVRLETNGVFHASTQRVDCAVGKDVTLNIRSSHYGFTYRLFGNGGYGSVEAYSFGSHKTVGTIVGLDSVGSLVDGITLPSCYTVEYLSTNGIHKGLEEMYFFFSEPRHRLFQVSAVNRAPMPSRQEAESLVVSLKDYLKSEYGIDDHGWVKQTEKQEVHSNRILERMGLLFFISISSLEGRGYRVCLSIQNQSVWKGWPAKAKDADVKVLIDEL